MWRKLRHEEFLDKVKAVVVGHAVADAVGVPYENSWREDLDKAPATDMVGGGYYNMPKGSWSDDTSMSLCELDAFAWAGDDKIALHNYTMENFYAWITKEEFTPTGVLFDCGDTCYTAVMQGYGEDGVHRNGNGSLMRIHPYVLKNFYEINKNGGKVTAEDASRYLDVISDGSKLTHAHPRSVLACLLYAGILTKLLVCPQKSSVKEGLNAILRALDTDKETYNNVYGFVRCELEENTYKRLFDGIEKVRRDEINSSGYVVDTLEAAVWCLMTTDNYRDCVLAAVNLGRDTDSVAAVAGGLAGALYGYEAIPEEWRAGLIKLDYILSLCDDAFEE